MVAESHELAGVSGCNYLLATRTGPAAKVVDIQGLSAAAGGGLVRRQCVNEWAPMKDAVNLMRYRLVTTRDRIE